MVEWVLADQEGWESLEGDSGWLYWHDAVGGLNVWWLRGPRGQPRVVEVIEKAR